jgi:hypothetical protein
MMRFDVVVPLANCPTPNVWDIELRHRCSKSIVLKNE